MVKKEKKLNLGSGRSWKLYPNHDGVDRMNFGQKYVEDVFDFFERTVPEEEYDEIIANHFLEHFNQEEVKRLINLVYKALKEGCEFHFVVPHKSKDKAWDLTHKTFWNEYTAKSITILDGFGSWEIERLVTNGRLDIHVWLKKKK